MQMTPAIHRFMRSVAIVLVAGILVARQAPAEERPWIEIQTSVGTLIVELFPDKAPQTVSNFLGYVTSGFYNGTIIHRAWTIIHAAG